MRKKVLAVLLILTTVIALSSCGNNYIEVSDNDGKKITVMKDKDGFAKTDDKGQLIIYKTNEKGKIEKDENKEDVTQIIKFPKYISSEDEVECESFSIKIPEGWTLQTGQMIKLYKDETKSEISFTLRTTDTVEDCIAQIKELYDEQSWKPNWKEEDIDFGFAKGKMISSSKLIENYEKSYYVFTVNGNTYLINTSLNTVAAKSEDFVSIIKTMLFK